MTTMLEPKLPIVFAKFHPATDPKPPKGKSSGMEIPDNADEIMTREEFSAFIRAYLLGIANQVRALSNHIYIDISHIVASNSMIFMNNE